MARTCASYRTCSHDRQAAAHGYPGKHTPAGDCAAGYRIKQSGIEGMSNRKLSGYWMGVGAVTLMVAVAVWFKGPAIHPSPMFRVTVVLLIGAILLLLRGTVIAAWRFV